MNLSSENYITHGGKNIHIFRNFYRENWVLYEFVNREWIKFGVIIYCLTRQNYRTCIKYKYDEVYRISLKSEHSCIPSQSSMQIYFGNMCRNNIILQWWHACMFENNSYQKVSLQAYLLSWNIFIVNKLYK